MSEKIIRAKRYHRIWMLSGRFNQPFDLIDVIAWAVGPNGPPIPITPMGRIDKDAEYVLGTETGWIVLPSGQTFDDSHAVAEWLRSRHAA